MKQSKPILAIARPDLLRDWDYEKNDSICSPEETTSGSGKIVWWKCHICGFEYSKRIADVANGHGCRQCGIKRIGVINTSPNSKRNRNSKLVSDYPEIAAEWDYEKNRPLTPNDLTAFSEKKVWWICPNGHSYSAIPGNRTRLNSGCPICAGKIVLKGFNDLESQYPKIAKLWNYNKNKLLPSQIISHSNKKVWWICVKGHEWKASPNNLVNGTSCPYCSSSLRTSLPEQAIVYYLSKITKTLGREKLFGWEVDAFLPDHNIAIEYDGIYYHSSKDVSDRDKRKEKELKEKGVTLIRVKESLGFHKDSEFSIYYDRTKKYHNYSDALKRLIEKINEVSNQNYDIKIDFEKDRTDILKTYKTHIKQNSIIKTNPDLEVDWNYAKNGNLLPDMFSSGSGEKVWWICSKGHEWKATIASRAAGAGCPYCSGFKWKPGESDLETKFPEIAAEWDYEKNYPLTPREINPGSHKKIWWICPKNHSYDSTVLNRTNPSNHGGCPYCSNKRVLKGFNDLETQFPKLALEWDYEKNLFLPSEVIPGSFKEVWWKCPNCNCTYKQKIIYRTRNNSNCPNCRQAKVLCVET